MLKSTISTERWLAGGVARRILAGLLMCSCAGSPTVWMNETILLDVLGSFPADLILRDRHRRRVWLGDGMRVEGRREVIAATDLAQIVLNRSSAPNVPLQVPIFLFPAVPSTKEKVHDDGDHEKER